MLKARLQTISAFNRLTPIVDRRHTRPGYRCCITVLYFGKDVQLRRPAPQPVCFCGKGKAMTAESRRLPSDTRRHPGIERWRGGYCWLAIQVITKDSPVLTAIPGKPFARKTTSVAEIIQRAQVLSGNAHRDSRPRLPAPDTASVRRRAEVVIALYFRYLRG